MTKGKAIWLLQTFQQITSKKSDILKYAEVQLATLKEVVSNPANSSKINRDELRKRPGKCIDKLEVWIEFTLLNYPRN